MSTSTVLLTEHARRYMHYAPPSFYPRDTVLARVLAMNVSVSLCLSVTSRCSIKRGERTNLVFGMEASFDQSYTVI